ncbi:hypothetical protein FOS14_19675 [Skermania sp. ID1734]|uniref:hypothetical protein n=1 Tax=Skermania sp. ID1734 TaxID=2597516 RepID=UPI00117FDE82|nr:hypothetical protein [Skermania sp. ID1734]TSD94863.1 hypothetical protein FOS14_19675 [Skermania sp. ID1734]
MDTASLGAGLSAEGLADLSLEDLIAAHGRLAAAEESVRAAMYERISNELEFAGHGRLSELARITGLSREKLRQLRRPYYRSIVRRDGESAAYIKQPSDNVHPDVDYQIRDTDRTTVLAVVPGQTILDLRRRQLAAYLTEDPRRTNISMVDVAELLPPQSNPTT